MKTEPQISMGFRKASLRGKFIATQAYVNKLAKSQINNLTLHTEELEIKEQTNPQISKEGNIIDENENEHNQDQKNVEGSMKLR